MLPATTIRDGERRQVPLNAFRYAPNLNVGDAETLADVVTREDGIEDESSNLVNVIERQVRVGVFLSTQVVTSATSHLVVHVVLRRADKKVGGVHTRTIVAGVTHKETVGDRTVSEFVCNVVSSKLKATAIGNDGSVSCANFACFPFPTSVGFTFGVLGMKPFRQGYSSMTHALYSNTRRR